MIAIILAAGYGTRLGTLTENKAKPLLSIAGKTILDHILRKVQRLKDISSIYIVTNNKFYPDFQEWRPKNGLLAVNIINDRTMSNEDRLGSIGDIHFVLQQEKIDDDLLVIGGDNLFEDDLEKFLSFFKQKGSAIMLHDVRSLALAQTLGVASINQQSQITSFIEKPEQPSSTMVSTLIYALKKDHLPLIKEALAVGKADRAGDFIAYLAERQPVYGMLLAGRWFDVGTIESLNAAEEAFTR
ncbi:nucleotidyltransferase family protein [Candidatus Woesearchaeota archaeon]|nr:nucleotidyltransferase family protein [Candidatus Woesearchaeota archaeon]